MAGQLERVEKKGKRNLVCIVCPVGCRLEATVEAMEDELHVKEVSGADCKRGRDYAERECSHPTRTLTSTMRVMCGKRKLVPVKTSKPIPKDMLFACMIEINRTVVNAPIAVGQVLIKNILNTGADIVATYEIEAWD